VPVHPRHKPQHRTVSASTQHLTRLCNSHVKTNFLNEQHLKCSSSSSLSAVKQHDNMPYQTLPHVSQLYFPAPQVRTVLIHDFSAAIAILP